MNSSYRLYCYEKTMKIIYILKDIKCINYGVVNLALHKLIEELTATFYIITQY